MLMEHVVMVKASLQPLLLPCKRAATSCSVLSRGGIWEARGHGQGKALAASHVAMCVAVSQSGLSPTCLPPAPMWHHLVA